MPDYTSKLIEKLVIIYEMDGMNAVEAYAAEHGIPISVCRSLIEEYEAANETLLDAAE